MARRLCRGLPRNAHTGILGTSDEQQAAFEDFAPDAPCPALNTKPDSAIFMPGAP